ncbi:MAG: alpha/beta hydrolase, partial [Dehalococcoidia bacterium]
EQMDEGGDGALARDDLRLFLDHLGYDRVTLVGMGGTSAIDYAAAHPEPVAALVLVDAGPEPMPQGQASTMAFHAETDVLERFEDFLDRAMQFNPARKPEHIAYSLTHSLKQTDRGWTWKQDPRGRDRVRAMPLDERRAAAERRNAALWTHLEEIATPTLVVRGDASKTLAADIAERMVDTFDTAHLVTVEGASGYVPGDQPRAFAQALDAFMAETLPR